MEQIVAWPSVDNHFSRLTIFYVTYQQSLIQFTILEVLLLLPIKFQILSNRNYMTSDMYYSTQ